MRLVYVCLLMFGLTLMMVVTLLINVREPVTKGSVMVYRGRGDVFYEILPNGRHRPSNTFFVDSPVVSPDGKWILYSAIVDGDRELFRIRPNGTSRQQLTDNDVHDVGAVYSPDGEWIAFGSSVNHRIKLFRMRANGSNVEQLADNDTSNSNYSWSADGQSVYFVGISGFGYLYRTNVDGSYWEQVSDTRLEEARRFWSPDGEWLFYTQFAAHTYLLYRMRLDGSASEYLTTLWDRNIESGVVNPRFSPDNEWIAFTSRHKPTSTSSEEIEVYRIRNDGYGLQRLTSNQMNERVLGWSPDGEWIIFRAEQGFNSELYRIHPDGSNLEQLTSNNIIEESIVWLPFIGLPFESLTNFVTGIVLVILSVLWMSKLRRRIA